jgi:hypothetical protein
MYASARIRRPTEHTTNDHKYRYNKFANNAAFVNDEENNGLDSNNDMILAKLIWQPHLKCADVQA